MIEIKKHSQIINDWTAEISAQLQPRLDDFKNIALSNLPFLSSFLRPHMKKTLIIPLVKI